MTKILTINSAQRGTGATHIAANVAAMLAVEGRRVGLIDIDLQAPSLHFLFGLDETEIPYSLNDYLLGRSAIGQATIDVTTRASAGTIREGTLPASARLYLVPGSMKPHDITEVLREGFEVDRLGEGFQELCADLTLDVLVIDTRAGLSEDTLLSIALSDAVAITLRLDKKDYQGTDVAVEVARRLEVPHIMLIVNLVPAAYDLGTVKGQVQDSYHCEVAEVLPYSDQLMALASQEIFVMRYPEHPTTALFGRIAARLLP